MEHFAIYDAHDGATRLYIDRVYDRRDRAQADLDDLLRPYPQGHEWRRRLRVLPRGAFGDPMVEDEARERPAEAPTGGEP